MSEHELYEDFVCASMRAAEAEADRDWWQSRAKEMGRLKIYAQDRLARAWNLVQHYEDAAQDHRNEGEIIYADACAEFASELRDALQGPVSAHRVNGRTYLAETVDTDGELL